MSKNLCFPENVRIKNIALNMLCYIETIWNHFWNFWKKFRGRFLRHSVFSRIRLPGGGAHTVIFINYRLYSAMDIFMKHSNPRNMTVLFSVQILYDPTHNLRIISQNRHLMMLFKIHEMRPAFRHWDLRCMQGTIMVHSVSTQQRDIIATLWWSLIRGWMIGWGW